MSSAPYSRHWTAGALAFYAGRYRESADEYWAAYLSVPGPTDRYRYFFLHGCTSTLRLNNFDANDDDFDNLRSIFENKRELRLFRLEAAFTLAILHYDRFERHKSEELYHDAIALGEKKLKKDRDVRREETCLQVDADTSEKSMKELIAGRVNDCKKNLDQLNHATRGAPGTVFAPEDASTTRTQGMPLGRGGTSLTQGMINNLLDVGGLHCDYCKSKDAKLFKCSLCKRAFYCSKDCQTKQWKEGGHKKYCRKEGQFEPGDFVQLGRLKQRPELNGYILRVVGRDATATEERYKVRMEGAVRGDNVVSVKAENLNQLRPYDCVECQGTK